MLGKRGQIVSWTIIRVPPADFSYIAPYAVAVVKLESGRNIIAQIVDCEEERIKIGLKVATVIRRTSRPDSSEVIPYGVKVKPV